MHLSTKTYGHNIGLSATFRQHKAQSHCNRLHGYALQVSLVFSATSLDGRGWVVDFGAMKPIKKYLEDTFDHKTLIAKDDPLRIHFEQLAMRGGLDIIIVPAIGCESFAEQIHDYVSEWLEFQYLPSLTDDFGSDFKLPGDLQLDSVEVREHGANSAIYSI